MKHSSKTVDIYNPNKQVQVRVTNTPKYEDDEFVDYERTVTITINAGRDKEKMKFNAKGEGEDIAKFIETIDFEDPQTSMDLSSGEDKKK